jgi:hypothetical protein
MSYTYGLLERLKEIERDVLPDLLRDKDKIWKTVDVIYHPPHVERCWMQLEDVRLFLHCIHPEEDAMKCLWHPHDWPSAMKIVSGTYAHDIAISQGYDDFRFKDLTPEVTDWLARSEVTAGTYYEMSHPMAWHRVRPIGQPVYSLMIAGPLYEEPEPSRKPLEKQPPLSSERKKHLLHMFRCYFCPEYAAGMDEFSY